MHHHRSGYRSGWPYEERRQALLDPRKCTLVGLLGTRVIVEDADRRHGVVRRIEAMRWARALLAGGRAKPEKIAIAAASPAEWDDHFQALSEMAGFDLHFVHGRKALWTPEGQLAAALAEVLLRGFSQARMTRLMALLRSQNPDFKIVPVNWWRVLPEDAPLLRRLMARCSVSNVKPGGRKF